MTNIPLYRAPVSPVISPMSNESLGASLLVSTGSATPVSASWPTNNLAIYVPFTLDRAVAVSKLFVCNGATITGNIDIGIYSNDGTRIVSAGSTAQSGTTACQVVSITATTIGPGQYYVALASSNTGATFYRYAPTTPSVHFFGVYQQATAFPLPASATFTAPTNNFIPVFGFATTGTF